MVSLMNPFMVSGSDDSVGDGVDLGKTVSSPVVNDSLAFVEEMRQNLADAQADLEHAVKVARQSGESWAAIGDVLGLSKQTAHLRYAVPKSLRLVVAGRQDRV